MWLALLLLVLVRFLMDDCRSVSLLPKLVTAGSTDAMALSM
jgi:hypothetical protein